MRCPPEKKRLNLGFKRCPFSFFCCQLIYNLWTEMAGFDLSIRTAFCGSFSLTFVGYSDSVPAGF